MKHLFRKQTPCPRAVLRQRGHLSLALLVLSFMVLAVPATGNTSGAGRHQNCKGPLPDPGYEYSVVAEGLPAVDNLAMTADGTLYATLERKKGRGELVRILGSNRTETMLYGLRRPDGLRAYNGKLYIAEESRRGRLIEYDPGTGAMRTIARPGYIEGLNITPSGDFLVTRDRKKGSLLHIGRSGQTAVLLDGLQRPEGIARGRQGQVYLAETATGRVLVIKDGAVKTLVEGIEKPDQVAVGPGGVVFITEDAKPGRLLSYRDGRLGVIARCLYAPQGILPLDNGLLVSEQGRNRILRFRKK